MKFATWTVMDKTYMSGKIMTEQKHNLEVKINSVRPDFRVFVDYLWGADHNFDSDGDSYDPASRVWTELYMSSREIENQSFMIGKIKDDPLVFEVSSENKYLLNRVVYFLKRETHGITQVSDETLLLNMGDDFNLEEALARADASIWRKSGPTNPFPNLK